MTHPSATRTLRMAAVASLAIVLAATLVAPASATDGAPRPAMNEPPRPAAVPTERSPEVGGPGWSGFAPTTQDAAQELWNERYLTQADGAIAWNGSIDTCTPGTTSAAFRAGVLRRINYFRAMAGVPDDIVFSDQRNTEAQAAALMMAANQALSHDPPDSWDCFSPVGWTGADESNLVLGRYGAEAITLFMLDSGANNTSVGHRKWLLYPPTRTMGTGDVPVGPGPNDLPGANALVVFDDHLNDPFPATREDFVAWPPPGYVPHPVIFPRWSFSRWDADLDGAVVTMTRNGTPVTLHQYPAAHLYRMNSLVWEPQVTPAQGDVYHVSITGAVVDGVSRDYAYDVRPFAPNDTTSPSIHIGVPAQSSTYALGQSVTAEYTCADEAGGSGVSTCDGTVAPGALLDTATLGEHEFSVTANDRAGNRRSATRTYRVATRPDALIATRASGPFLGDDVYDSAPSGTQAVSGSMTRGSTRTYTVRIGNDAAAPATFTLKGASHGSLQGRFRVDYVQSPALGGADITAAVAAGTYRVADLAPGSTVAIKVRVTATSSTAPGSWRTVSVTARSTVGPRVKDTVQAFTSVR